MVVVAGLAFNGVVDDIVDSGLDDFGVELIGPEMLCFREKNRKMLRDFFFSSTC